MGNNKKQETEEIERIKELFIKETGWDWKSEVWFNSWWCSCISYKNITVYYESKDNSYRGYISMDNSGGHYPIFGKLPKANTPKELISKVKKQVKNLSKRIQEIENNLT